jgi:NTE family protein
MGRFSKIVRSVKAFKDELSHARAAHHNVAAPSKRPRIGVALGGGFARGMSHIGVLKVLEEERIPIDFIAGTSVGAVIGGAYCSGLCAKEMEELAMLVRFKDFARWTISRFGLCSNDRMTGFLMRLFRVYKFEELRIPLAIAATDFATGQGVIFNSGSLIDAVRASCAYPGMFLPVSLEGKLYVDGLLGYPVPAKPLREMGAERVIAAHLPAYWVTGRGPRHIFDVIGQCFSIAQDRMTSLWKQHADIMIEPDCAQFGYDEFQRSPEMIAIGEAAAREVLPQIRSWLAAPEAEREPVQTPQPSESNPKPTGAPALRPSPLPAK